MFDDVTCEPLAVRGERIALSRLAMTAADGFEVPYLAIFEHDERGRVSRGVSFDDTDLVAALGEMDARYRAIRGDEPGVCERLGTEHGDAFNRRDWAAVEACYAADFVAVDHRPSGFPESGRAAYLDRMRTVVEAAPDVVLGVCKSYFADRATVMVVQDAGATPEGREYSGGLFAVAKTDAQGRFARCEYFPDDQWTEALARFDEWARASAPAEVTVLSSEDEALH